MTARRVVDAETAAYFRDRGVAGLGLFDAQREAAPEVARPRLEYPGPSTEARRMAKAKADTSLTGRRGKILLALRAHGPMTRLALTEVTGLAENSVNSATNALLKDGKVHLLDHLDPATGRSIVAVTETDDG